MDHNIRGDLTSVTPIGIPLIRILDHFVLGLGCRVGEWEGRLRELVRDALIWGAASWSVCGVDTGPPVITRLPLAVHLMVTSWI